MVLDIFEGHFKHNGYSFSAATQRKFCIPLMLINEKILTHLK